MGARKERPIWGEEPLDNRPTFKRFKWRFNGAELMADLNGTIGRVVGLNEPGRLAENRYEISSESVGSATHRCFSCMCQSLHLQIIGFRYLIYLLLLHVIEMYKNFNG